MNKNRSGYFKNLQSAVSAFIEKKPFEECKKRMDLLLSAELERSERNDCVNLISWASRTFYDIKAFSMFWGYLEKSAIPLTNLENSILLYWLSKYYTGDEELKKTATENLIACGIVYYECYEEAIEYAVEQKKYNSLDVLNKKYAELNLNNMDLWGRLTYEELD